MRELLATGKVLFIVGSGVSAGATDWNPLASWQGLIKNGLAETGKVANVPQKQLDAYSELVDTGDLHNLLSAASFVTAKLQGPKGGDYKAWLRQTFEGLRAKRREVLEALKNLPVTLATTNYDGLLEEVTGRPAVTWRETNKVERVLRGDGEGIVHFHGFWDDSGVRRVPRSRRITSASSRPSTRRRCSRRFASLKTLVFVGCRYGLLDPNFGNLLRGRAGVPPIRIRHYLLAPGHEVDGIRAEHSRDEAIAWFRTASTRSWLRF